VIEGGIPSVPPNPAGLTGIWATENTRDALFDALRRRETFAASGVRQVPRLLGGWDLSDADVADFTVAHLADRGIRPMTGGEIRGKPWAAPYSR
jgi:Protein of unknown function (DUF3604)